MAVRIDFDRRAIAAFCKKWRIRELSFFGSVLRADFNQESDVDVLVTFDPSAAWSLFDLVGMEDELSTLFARRVDLVTRHAIEQSRNWLRREEILSSAERVYVEG